jgi:site-specific DNA-methyltransferase (adenine-specific)
LSALKTFLGTNDMMAYLVMMAVRLKELHRVLKPTGSIYLHCDPTASHYLKLLMDSVFGLKNFRNEIVWCHYGGGQSKRRFPRKHDILLFYGKGTDVTFNADDVRVPYDSAYSATVFGKKGDPNQKIYGPNPKGKIPEDFWVINRPYGKERIGYPTQKPEALLERIIKASSNEGDIVLDPFCGCGTAISVAERLKRKWIGIDVTHLAVTLMKKRLQDTFAADLAPYEVIGEPKDLAGAHALADQDRYQFEWWALGLVDAQPAQDKKKGADKGIDGLIYFLDNAKGEVKKALVQVKSGHVQRAQVSDLCHAVDRENAAIGLFVTLEKPTRPMIVEAATAGFYEATEYGKKYQRVQILTIEDLINGKQADHPREGGRLTFKQARLKNKTAVQQEIAERSKEDSND